MNAADEGSGWQSRPRGRGTGGRKTHGVTARALGGWERQWVWSEIGTPDLQVSEQQQQQRQAAPGLRPCELVAEVEWKATLEEVKEPNGRVLHRSPRRAEGLRVQLAGVTVSLRASGGRSYYTEAGQGSGQPR